MGKFLVADITRGTDYAFVYFPNGHEIEVSLDKIPGSERLSNSIFLLN